MAPQIEGLDMIVVTFILIGEKSPACEITFKEGFDIVTARFDKDGLDALIKHLQLASGVLATGDSPDQLGLDFRRVPETSG